MNLRLHTMWLLAVCSLIFACGCEGSAKLEVSPTELNFALGETCREFVVKNVGDEGMFTSEVNLEYEANTQTDWITAGQKGVCAVGEEQSCRVCVNRDRMLSGVNAGAVFISSNGGDAVVAIRAEN